MHFAVVAPFCQHVTRDIYVSCDVMLSVQEKEKGMDLEELNQLDPELAQDEIEKSERSRVLVSSLSCMGV